jgi:hypothetical protein
MFRKLDFILRSGGFPVATNFESNSDAGRISQETTNIGKHETNNINNL